MPGGEFIRIKHGSGHRNVLLFAAGIGKAKVDKLDFVVRNLLDHVIGGS
jgi:hypothetical protein